MSIIKTLTFEDSFRVSKYDKKNSIFEFTNIRKLEEGELNVSKLRLSLKFVYNMFNNENNDSFNVKSIIMNILDSLINKNRNNKIFLDRLIFTFKYDMICRMDEGSYDRKAIRIFSIGIKIDGFINTKSVNRNKMIYSVIGDSYLIRSDVYTQKTTCNNFIVMMLRKCYSTNNIGLKKRSKALHFLINATKSSSSRLYDVITFDIVSMFMACEVYKMLEKRNLVNLIPDYYVNNINEESINVYDPSKSIISILHDEFILDKNEELLLSNISVYMMKRVDDLLYKSYVMDPVSFCSIPFPGLILSGYENIEDFSKIISMYDYEMRRITTLSNTF